MVTCNVETCDRPRYCRGMCTVHYQRNRIGNDLSIGVGLAKIVGYRAAHYRVQSKHGRAKEYDCACGCLRAAEEWALIPGVDNLYYCDKTGRAYSLDPDDYAPMARYCHRVLDGNLPPH
jgi:hypothetical protein